MGLVSGDPLNLGDSGWGVIFAAQDQNAEAVREALQPLLDLRRAQVGVREHYYRVFCGDRGYREGDSKHRFLARHGVGPGAADPERMPYYLLLVGDPEMIPYEFQYQLDMQYAVGRLWFETVEGYGEYARNVVAAETSPRTGERTAAFFAPQHPEDAGTELGATKLAAPLAERAAKSPGWSVSRVFGEEATKVRLRSLVGGEETPDLLFMAGHGVMLKNDHPHQSVLQGALLCGEWPGPNGPKVGIPATSFFSGDDVRKSERLRGMISFHISCFSAGGPAWDDFSALKDRRPVAPKPFISRLPLRLLRAGVLAVIGHVERAWYTSIEWPGAGVYIQPFEDALDRLLAGHPVGSAMESFGQRYAELASDLSVDLEEIMRGGEPVEEARLLDLWIYSHDARNYTVLGDPAVRLAQPMQTKTGSAVSQQLS